MFKATVLIVQILSGLLILLSVLYRPYVFDALQYAWWRLNTADIQNGEVHSGDALISFRVVGHGTPLVLLHGGMSSSLDWYAQIPALSERFKLILIDSRGHGESTLGDQDLSYGLLAEDVFAVLDSLRINKFDVAGWSDGGNIGLLLALKQPERVNRLVAISANTHPDGLTAEAKERIADLDAESPSLLAQWLYKWQSPDHSSLVPMRVAVTALWHGKPLVSEKQTRTITTPTLLMIGEEDDVALSHARTMEDSMSNATLIVVPDAGHTVPQTASTQVRDAIIRFLEFER